MPYEKTHWRPGQGPGISAERLNKIEQGIADAHQLVDESTLMLELDFASASEPPSVFPLGITTFRTWSDDAGWPTQHGLVTTNYQQDNAYAYQTFLSTDSDAVFMYRNWASDRQQWREWKRMADGESFDEHVANTNIHHIHHNQQILNQLTQDIQKKLVFNGVRYVDKPYVDGVVRDVANLNLHLEASQRVENGATIGDTFDGSGELGDGGIGMSWEGGNQTDRTSEGISVNPNTLSSARRITKYNSPDGNVPEIDFESLGIVLDDHGSITDTLHPLDGHQRFLKLGDKYFLAVSEIKSDITRRRHVILVSEDNCQTWDLHASVTSLRASNFCAMDTDGNHLFIVYTQQVSSTRSSLSHDIHFCRVSVETGNVSERIRITSIGADFTHTTSAMLHYRPTIHFSESRNEIHIACVVNYNANGTVNDVASGRLRHWYCNVDDYEWEGTLPTDSTGNRFATDAYITSDAQGFIRLYSIGYFANFTRNVLYVNLFDNSKIWAHSPASNNAGYGYASYTMSEPRPHLFTSARARAEYASEFPLHMDVNRDARGNHYISFDFLTDVDTTTLGDGRHKTDTVCVVNNGSSVRSDEFLRRDIGDANINAYNKFFIDAFDNMALLFNFINNAGWSLRIVDPAQTPNISALLFDSADVDSSPMFGLYELQVVKTRDPSMLTELNIRHPSISNVPPTVWYNNSDNKLHFTGFWRDVLFSEPDSELNGSARYRIERNTNEVVLWIQTTEDIENLRAFANGAEIDRGSSANSLGTEYKFVYRTEESEEVNIDLELTAKSQGRQPIIAITKIIGGVSVN